MLPVFNIVLLIATLASDDLCSKQLDYLLALHREFGLQLPPREAVLVDCGGPELDWAVPGESCLVSTRDGHTPWDRPRKLTAVRCVRPDLVSLDGAKSRDWLELALAFHERGWKPLARAALRKWAVKNFQYPWDAETWLGFETVMHWEGQIVEAPDRPLSVIAKYLRRAQKYRLDSSSAELLRSVELALEPRNSTPGSDEALIDALTEARGSRGPSSQPGGMRQDPRYRALLERGLAAVPVLLAHLTDERITRARGRGCGDTHRRVKEVVLEILADLRGAAYAMEGCELAQQRKELGAWFAGASKLGEEMYLISHVLGRDEDSSFCGGLVHVLAIRYPRRLPEVFRAVIDARPEQHGDARHYARAIAESPIPVVEKRKVLEYAAKQDDPVVRAAGLRYLRQFDSQRQMQFLKDLAELPIDPDASQIGLAGEVAERADADEWSALSGAVRRVSATSRIGLLNEISRAQGAAGRKNRLAVLVECLADADIGTDNSADARFAQLEVRNFAATRLAELLNMEEEIESGWSAARWAEFRERVWVSAVKDLLRR